MEPSALTPALVKALAQKAKEIREILAQSKPVTSTRKVPENGPMRRVFRRSLRDLCNGNVRTVKTVERDPLERLVTRFRLDHGIRYEDEPYMVLDVRDEVIELLACAALEELRQRETSRATTAPPVIPSPRTKSSRGGTT